MELSYQYNKLRKNFGRQYFFHVDGPRIVEDLKPDKWIAQKYLVKTPVCKGVQVGYSTSEHWTNTHVKDYNDRGMNHVEGGWPKEVDNNDEEVVLRFRKKVERLDNYVAAMQRLTKPMEHAILQNNAVNIYEKYFGDDISMLPTEKETCRIQSKFRDPQKPRRPITYCSWSPDGTQFCVAYCNTLFQTQSNTVLESYIWDLERPLIPEMALVGNTPILSLEYNARDPQWLVAGLLSGQVTHFDTRRGSNSIATSLVDASHQDPAHSVLWINSKSGAEFFSTSSDGVVKWWDCRRLERPIEYIVLDPSRGDKPSITKAYQPSCLEYEQSIPSRFMVGTETGYVINGNRKGTTTAEKIPIVQKCQSGPIYALQRNQGFMKNFLVVGTWCAKIWSEDCRESPIIWTKNYPVRLTGGEWSATRLSVFFLIREDGYLDLWDIIMDQENPTFSMKLCEDSLTALRPIADGTLVLAGNTSGTTFLVRFPSYYAESLKNEKNFLSAMFERESRREKLLEGKNREMKLKQKEIMMAKQMEGEPHEKTELELKTESFKEFLEQTYLTEVEIAMKQDEGRREKRKQEQEQVEEEEVEEEEGEEEQNEN